MSDWWLSRASGTPEGPFPTQLLVQGLSAGQIPVQAYVCRVGEQRWIRISQVDEIWIAAHPDQDKTQVNERPWFESSQAKLAHDVQEINRLGDEDDENERTQIITPMPVLAPGPSKRNGVTPVPLAQSSPRTVPTPLPVVTQSSPRAVPTPLPVVPQFPQKSALTPLPHHPTAATRDLSTHRSTGAVLPSPPKQNALQTPLPQALSQQQNGPARTVPAPLPQLPLAPRVATTATQELPIRPKIPTLEGISAQSTATDTLRHEPAVSAGYSSPGHPEPPRAGATASTLSGPERVPPAGSDATLPKAPLQGSLGLKGLGLGPLPKAPTPTGLVPGLSALPSLPTPPPITTVAQQAASSSAPIAIPATATPAAHSVDLARSRTAPSPILGNASAVPNPVQSQAKGPPPPIATNTNGFASTSATELQLDPLDDADHDEVTRIATPGLLVDNSRALSAFDDDVTKIVSADKLPDASRGDASKAVAEPRALRSAPVLSPEPSAFAAPQPSTSSPRSSAPSVSVNHEAELSSELVADPADLLEEDVDETSLPIRNISRGPYPSTAPLRREKTPIPPSLQPAPQSAGPVISVPPKAVHQSTAPSIVLKPEPIVHQEATKPAVRALRPPGVVQITYGTLVIAALGVVLLVLVLVLVLK